MGVFGRLRVLFGVGDVFVGGVEGELKSERSERDEGRGG